METVINIFKLNLYTLDLLNFPLKNQSFKYEELLHRRLEEGGKKVHQLDLQQRRATQIVSIPNESHGGWRGGLFYRSFRQ